MARSKKSRGALRPARRADEPRQFHRPPPIPPRVRPGLRRARRRLSAHARRAFRRRRREAPAGVVRRFRHEDESQPALFAGDQGPEHRPQHRRDRHPTPRRSRTRPRGPARIEGPDERRGGHDHGLVSRLSHLAAHAPVWRRGEQGQEQPRHVRLAPNRLLRSPHRR